MTPRDYLPALCTLFFMAAIAAGPVPARAQSSPPEPASVLVRMAAGAPAPAPVAASKNGSAPGASTGADPVCACPSSPALSAAIQAAGLDRWYRVSVPEGADAAAVARAYAELSGVEAAAPAALARPALLEVEATAAMPDDPAFGSHWNLHNTGQTIKGTAGTPDADMDVLEAWDVERGDPRVVVQVVDVGIDMEHPDLQGNLWINAAEDANGNGRFDPFPAAEGGDFNGLDDDGNGYVDDVSGWDFLEDDPNPHSDDLHGTAMAGIIAAKAGNGTGIAGVAGGERSGEGVRIMPARIGASTWVDESLAVGALCYATCNGAAVSSNSWVGSGSEALQSAVDFFLEHAGGEALAGGVVVASVANDGDEYVHFPASHPGVIAVASTDYHDQRASNSNYGDRVDLAAPGQRVPILNTAAADGWQLAGGASAAAAAVSGVAALLISHAGGAAVGGRGLYRTGAAVRDRLREAAEAIDALNPGVEGKLGAGRVNALWALTEVAALPVELVAFTARRDGARVVLGWATASEAGNAGFAIERATADGGFTEVAFVAGAGTSRAARSYAFADAAPPAEALRYRLRQVDHDGASTLSATVEVAAALPEGVVLGGNYPNPFNPATTIRFALPAEGRVRLAVYDLLGREVALLVDGVRAAGWHAVAFDASHVPSGVYLYRLEAGATQAMGRMLLQK